MVSISLWGPSDRCHQDNSPVIWTKTDLDLDSEPYSEEIIEGLQLQTEGISQNSPEENRTIYQLTKGPSKTEPGLLVQAVTIAIWEAGEKLKASLGNFIDIVSLRCVPTARWELRLSP